MGKATIVSGGENGQYQVRLDYGKATQTERLAAIAARLAALVGLIAQALQDLNTQEYTGAQVEAEVEAAINAYVATAQALAALPADTEPAVLKAVQDAVKTALKTHTEALTKLAAAVRKTAPLRLAWQALKAEQVQLQKDQAKWAALVLEETVQAWCADLTEDATGEVATVEIPGESKLVLIAPAAPVPTAAHGALVAREVQTPAQVFFNAAILPGWQKYRPTHRRGVITAVDEALDKADVTLEVLDKSSAQGLGIDQAQTLAAVPVEYMTCNAGAFAVGDKCVVRFDQQDWTRPRVVGFVDNPRACNVALSGIVREGSLVMLPVPPGSPPGTVAKFALHSYKPTAQAWQYPLRSDPDKSPGAFNDEPRLGGAGGQYAGLSASMYSGRMAQAVQAIMGRGLPVAYGYAWALCHGVVIAQDGKAWLVQVSALGVFAMRMPISGARPGSPESVVSECTALFGGVPSNVPFPEGAAFNTKLADGLVIRLATAADVQGFYTKSPFAAHLGWAFKNDGSEAHNTAWRTGEGGQFFGCLYKLAISIGAEKSDWVKGQPLAAGTAAMTLVSEGRLVHAGLFYFRFGFALASGAITNPPAEQPSPLPMVAYKAPVHVCYVDDVLDVVYYVYSPADISGSGDTNVPDGGSSTSREQQAQCYVESTRFADAYPRRTVVSASASYSTIATYYGGYVNNGPGSTGRQVIVSLAYTRFTESHTGGGTSGVAPYGARDSYIIFNNRATGFTESSSGVTGYTYYDNGTGEPSGEIIPSSGELVRTPLENVSEYAQIIGRSGPIARLDLPADPVEAQEMISAWSSPQGVGGGAAGGMVVRYSVLGSNAHAMYTAKLWGDEYVLQGALLAGEDSPNPLPYNFIGFL